MYVVIIIGMPYPDPRDPILQMKLNYTKNNTQSHIQSLVSSCNAGTTLDMGRGGNNDKNDLYETLCMKSVNQSIGRAIRHINDYAVIILMDHRYTRPKTVSLLPKWIRASLHTYIQFYDAHNDIVTFFNNKM